VVTSDGALTLGGEAGERALQFWQDLVHVDKSMRGPPGRDYVAWDATKQDFVAGNTSMMVTSSAFLRYLEKRVDNLVGAPLPRDVRASVPTGGTFWVVLASAPQPEKDAAWAFIRWMCEPRQAIEWAAGTGYLPVTEAAHEEMRATGFYDVTMPDGTPGHPADLVAFRQLENADPWPWAELLFRIERDIIEPRLEGAVFANTDARRVLEDAREEARSARL
jgi:sn-glycerol 3-phosphate transport system substrate-binding protein